MGNERSFYMCTKIECKDETLLQGKICPEVPEVNYLTLIAWTSEQKEEL
jgi:hypothetical protein